MDSPMPLSLTLKFKAQTYEEFLSRLGVKYLVTSVEHPQTNGQAEASNKVIFKALRTRLNKFKGLWKEELPIILRAYKCFPQTTTMETLFCHIYGTDAMIPIKVKEPLIRRLFF